MNYIAMRKSLKESGLSLPMACFLEALELHGGTCTPGKASKNIGVSAASSGAMAKQAEISGFAAWTGRSLSGDRRETSWSITARGAKALQEAKAKMAELLAAGAPKDS